MTAAVASAAPVARVERLSQRFGRTQALDDVTLALPAGRMVALIGPDGVGKSSLLGLLAGARVIQQGSVRVLGGDMASRAHRRAVCPRIAYMPQGLGRNLYATLSVEENLQFFARLFDQGAAERRRRIDELTRSTGLHEFLARPAGQLSGGMKQKLGLCCALIHDPDLLILDEPTTGVDPLARAQFWDLIERIRARRPGMSVLVATAYMEEAARFDWIVALDAGRVLAEGTPAQLLERTGAADLEAAFIGLLPPERTREHRPVTIAPLAVDDDDIAIEAQALTMRFGDFVAVDQVSFRIRRGEIFGFLGSNGCGKTTTMKMLTGLLTPSEGRAWLFGEPVNPRNREARRQVGYMSQGFSLYSELTVRQNLVLHARLFSVPEADLEARVRQMLQRFGLQEVVARLPDTLPMGMRQRLSLAVAMVHRPRLLILDEPTSGVDPIARDAFWQLLLSLSRQDQVTIFLSTHFMNEAARCDRMSMMHAGRVLDSDTPARLVARRQAADLNEAFIGYLVDAGAGVEQEHEPAVPAPAAQASPLPHASGKRFSLRRLFSYAWRESLELQRDPVRAAMALLGSVLLMFIIGFGITLDVNELRYAVLDRDQSGASRHYALNLSGSRYFLEQPPLRDHADLDQRLRNGEISMAIEIPAGFARGLLRGRPVEVAAWIDGSMPMRAETVQGYVQGMHYDWLNQLASETQGGSAAPLASVELRYRYNPDVRSLPAMVPAVIPLLLLMLPAMLTALAVVRERELGSIVNLYVTPVTRTEFLIGKQLPYVALALVNCLCMVLLAVTAFGVPLTGSLTVMMLAAALYAVVATALGLVASTLTRSQIAAMFLTMIGTMLPAIQFSGLTNPVSSLEGLGRWVGQAYPATHMITISRGVFNKALGFEQLQGSLLALLLSIPVVMAAAIALLKKQDR